MAGTTATAVLSYHGTASATFADTVTIAPSRNVRLYNTHATIAIYYTVGVDGVAATTAAAAAESYILPAVSSVQLVPASGKITQLSIFPASGTPTYSVCGF